jgi:hypothetical protein
MAWIVAIPPSPRHPRERYQVCYQDGRRHRSAGIFPTKQRALAEKRAVERGSRDELPWPAEPDPGEGAHAVWRVRGHEVVAGLEGPASQLGVRHQEEGRKSASCPPSATSRSATWTPARSGRGRRRWSPRAWRSPAASRKDASKTRDPAPVPEWRARGPAARQAPRAHRYAIDYHLARALLTTHDLNGIAARLPNHLTPRVS